MKRIANLWKCQASTFLLTVLAVMSSSLWAAPAQDEMERSQVFFENLYPQIKLDGNVVRICRTPHDSPMYSHMERSTVPRNRDEIRRLSVVGLIARTGALRLSQYVNLMGKAEDLESYAKEFCRTQFKSVALAATEIAITKLTQRDFDLIRQVPVRSLRKISLNNGLLKLDSQAPSPEDHYLDTFKCIVPPHAVDSLPEDLLARLESRECELY